MSSAKSISETFDTLTAIDTANSTLILNTASGSLHPPLRIEGVQRNGGDPLENPLITVGDGKHGHFTLQNYASFSQGGDISGQIIRLDLSVYPELQVRSFVLDAGWTLAPIGDRPLVIRSLSTIIVRGTILCSGADGVAGTGAMTSVVAGGAGRCGGAAGGQGGGPTLTAPIAGTSPVESAGSGVTGGLISPPAPATDCFDGAAGVAGRCGGGGGAFSESGTPGLPTATRGGATTDKTFSFRAGAAGGAGGLSTSGAGSGGGGGGGGGFIDLIAVSGIDIEGSVLAKGGVGGSSNSLGAGGGGGGGTIMMAAGGIVQFRAGSAVSAQAGAGGATSAGGVTGGRGWVGRTFIVSRLAAGPECLSQLAAGAAAEVPDRHVASVGCVRYRTGSFIAKGVSVDFLSSNPQLQNVILSSSLTGGSTLVTDVASSRDGFTNHDSGFQTWTALPKSLDRYVKFQVTLNNQDAINGSRLDRIQFDYEPGLQSQFEFRSGCGSVAVLGKKFDRGSGGSGPRGPLTILFLIPLMCVFLLRRLRI